MTARERLSRRELVGTAIAGAAGAAAGSTAASASNRQWPTSRGRVIVLGGGLAGLTAAYELERSGYEAQVIEARKRLGGRVSTVDIFGGGQHAEAGGEFIDSHHRSIQDLCRRFGLEPEDARRGFAGLSGAVFRNDRTWRGYRFRTAADERTIASFWKRVVELARPLRGANPTAHGGAALDRRTAADLLDEMRIGGHARFLLEHTLRDDYGLDADELSLLYVAISERIAWGQPASGLEAFRIRGGNARLVVELTRRLVTPPMLASPAVTVRHGGRGVDVTLRDGEVVSGDRLVLAAPPPALRQIAFSPTLPPAEARAIRELDCCPVTKTIVQYRERIWRKEGYGGYAFTDLLSGSTWEATDQQPGRSGILIAYAAGSLGQKTAMIPHPDRTRIAKLQLDHVFPGLDRLTGRASSTAWAAERFSGGGWVSYRPGQVTRHWLALHAPVGPIHMAGEHTQELSGYMESAVASGQRVAREIAGG